LNYLRLTQLILQELPLEAAQRAHVLRQRDDLRADVARTVMHQLRSGIRVRWGLLMQCFAADAGTAWMFLPNVAKALWRSLAARRTQPGSAQN
jgi:hypothetical protein